MNYYALLLIVLILLAMYFLLGSFLWGAGYQPTPRSVLLRMMAMARIGPKDRVYDLGAGTGALVVRALDEGADSVVGIEIEPIRFWFLRWRQRRHPRGDHLELLREDFFKAELSDATVVLVFLWPGAMRRLDEKFRRELRPGTRVVSYWHPLEGWRALEEDPKKRVYLYEVPTSLRPASPGAASSAGPSGASP